MIKGQVFEVRTLHDLVLMVVRLRYENGLDDAAMAPRIAIPPAEL
jgi:hypothetical protein